MRALLFALLLSVSALAQIKKPEPPPVEPDFASSLQAVVVTTEGWNSAQGKARLFERRSTAGKWKPVGGAFDISVGRNGMAFDEDVQRSLIIKDAPTLTPVFKAYCAAWAKKDDEALRKVFSAQTLKEFEFQMKEDGTASISEFLENDRASNDFCEVSNEFIFGESAVAEVRSNAYPNGITILFRKENGAWKITNRRPDSPLMPNQKPKKEGDGRSPAGLMPLTYAFGTADKPETKLKYLRLAEHTECVDDSNSTHYNKIVNRMQVGIFDWKSSEKMAEITPEYDLGVFVAYNSYPPVAGRGSCIFLHVWGSPGDPTSGCTAMSRENMQRIVAWLDPKKTPYLVQMPETAYRHYEKKWKLPKLK